MAASGTVLVTLIMLTSFGVTVQNLAHSDLSAQRAVQQIIGQMVPSSRTPSPVGQAGHIGHPPAWDPLADRLFCSTISSPVTDSDSDLPRASSMSGTWATAWGAEDFKLPPPQSALEDEGSMDRACVEPVTEDSAGSSDEGAGLPRRCHLCKLMDATRGVAEESDSGRWVTLVCRHCSQFIKSTIPLSTRCHGCRRYANFGPVGGTRRDARHCKRHRQPYEVNVSRKRCDFRSEYSPVSGFHQYDTCPDVPIVSFKGSNFCAWHAQDLRGEGKGTDSSDSITVLPSAQKKSPRQCMSEGCQLTASFGDADKSALFCSLHRGPHHVDLVHKKRCEHGLCDKNPAYGLPSEGIARFCKEHRPGSFIDLRSRKCQYPYGCGKRPSFGDSSDGIARFCAEHKLSQHVNVKSRFDSAPPLIGAVQRAVRCASLIFRLREASILGCCLLDPLAREQDALPLWHASGLGVDVGRAWGGLAKAQKDVLAPSLRFASSFRLVLICQFCARCFCRKCQEQGCAKQPTFGATGDMVVRFCAVHRRAGDVDLVHPRCRKGDCLKVALFGYDGGNPQLCYAHRADRMVNVNVLVRHQRSARLRRPAPHCVPDGGGATVQRKRVPSWATSDHQPVVSPLIGWGQASFLTPASPAASSLSSEHDMDMSFDGEQSGRLVSAPSPPPAVNGEDWSARRSHLHLDIPQPSREVAGHVSFSSYARGMQAVTGSSW